MQIASLVLKANTTTSEERIAYLREAAELEDRRDYDEPYAWYASIRADLGQELLEERRYVEAEAVYRRALIRLQRNLPLLKGLALSLEGQGRTWDAFWVQREIDSNEVSQLQLPICF